VPPARQRRQRGHQGEHHPGGRADDLERLLVVDQRGEQGGQQPSDGAGGPVEQRPARQRQQHGAQAGQDGIEQVQQLQVRPQDHLQQAQVHEHALLEDMAAHLNLTGDPAAPQHDVVVPDFVHRPQRGVVVEFLREGDESRAQRQGEDQAEGEPGAPREPQRRDQDDGSGNAQRHRQQPEHSAGGIAEGAVAARRGISPGRDDPLQAEGVLLLESQMPVRGKRLGDRVVQRERDGPRRPVGQDDALRLGAVVGGFAVQGERDAGTQGVIHPDLARRRQPTFEMPFPDRCVDDGDRIQPHPGGPVGDSAVAVDHARLRGIGQPEEDAGQDQQAQAGP